MKNATALALILTGGVILLLSLPMVQASDQTERVKQGVIVEAPASTGPQDFKGREPFQPSDEQKQKGPVTPISMPVYRPPLRGAPVGRIAGGSRGIFDEFPTMLVVLSPDHTGQTVKAQPVLYWFLAESVPHPIEFTLILDQAIYPIIETRIPSPKQPGIQRIRLADYDVSLQPGVTYKWYVAMVRDPDRRSKDVLAWGAIERVEFTQDLRARLAETDRTRSAYAYAEAGLWYDAFSAVSDLIEAAPDATLYRQQRASLLEQVGLQQIAQYDLKQRDSGK
jgi:hypothetical protein